MSEHLGRGRKKREEGKESGRISLSENLSIEEAESVLETLPFDITFIDRNDTVRYFNRFGRRMFYRPLSVIGKKVQQCHPRKSIDKVNRILDEFRKGKRDFAEFWINFRGRFLYIRYFPVRDRKGEYIGTVEVSQDASRIRELKGEKRILDG